MLEIGRSLRETRSRRGLELAEVEASTMIRVRYSSARTGAFGCSGRSCTREASCASTPSSSASTATSTSTNTSSVSRLLNRPSPPPPQHGELVRRLSELSPTRIGVVVGAILIAGVAVWQLAGSGSTGTPTPPPTRATPAPTKPQTHARHTATIVKPPPRQPPAVLALTAARGSCWLSVRIGSSTGPTV